MVIKNNLVDFYSPSFTSMFVGFDRLFDSLSKATEISVPTYPPTNVSRDGENYTIEMALAGLDDNDIEVEVQERTLTIMELPNALSDDNLSWLMTLKSLVQP